VAFLAAREADLPRYAERGLRSFYLGDEAIVHCDTFTLDGAAMKGVRAAVRRVGKTHRFQLIRESDAPAGLVEQLNAISRQWRGKAPERGFTMSLSQDIEGAGRNRDFLLCVALDEHGAPGGFLRIVPAYGSDFGYTLDLMRHLPGAPNGMTEYLIAQTALALREQGVVRLSMNFAMWGRLFDEDLRFSLGQRIAKRAVVDVLNPFFQIKSLYDFNAKFSPEWLSRVLVYQEPTDLPRVGLLYAGAEGFLSIPGFGELFVPKAVGGVSSQPTAA
jgi:lysyl-tRNA synthetase class 2